VAHVGEKRNACKILVGKPKRKGPRPRSRCEDDISFLCEIVGERMDRIRPSRDGDRT
jgi:hypothetical protein